MSEPSTASASAELSCYTANLVAYLGDRDPGIRDRLAAAVHLRVRTEAADGGLAFSHHGRVDLDDRGRGLAYRGADDWDTARTALDAELTRHGAVLAVGNTRHIPWSPSYGAGETSHWLLLARRDGGWSVRDDFEALTPHGSQSTYSGLCDDAELRALLTPPSTTTPQALSRDRHALGEPVETAPHAGYRWLELSQAAGPPAPSAYPWTDELTAVLRRIADRVCADPGELARYADDIWTAARHQRFRLATVGQAAEPGFGAAPGTGSAAAPETVPEAASEAVPEAGSAAEARAAWGALPQAVRFGVASAERGRFRAGAVEKAFTQVLTAVERLEGTRSVPEGS